MNDCNVNNKYRILDKIGNGQFGNVYKAVHKKTNTYVAIKFENLDSGTKLLQHETTILNYLRSEGLRQVPTVLWYGLYGENLCLVMTLFEFSLFQYIQSRTLTLEKIYNIIRNCLSILESVHKKGVIHRDIKPENIMIKDGALFLIDFGFSTFYINDKREHIRDDRIHYEITGTPRWTSYYLHNGLTPSRRDDVISLSYIFLFMIYGTLPWISDTAYREKKSIENILSSIDDQTIQHFMKCCYELAFDEEPNYYKLNDILKNNIKK